LIHRFFEACNLSSLITQQLSRSIKLRFTLGSIYAICRVKLSDQVKTSHFEPALPLNFRKASELQPEPCLYFHDENLDRLIGGLRLGSVIFLYGSSQCSEFSELLCVRSQLSPRRGGFDSGAIFVDAGNTFDPYLISHYAEQFLLDRDRALDRILVSRAFTYHQLTSLITQVLPRTVHERKARLIIVSDMPKLYCDPDARHNQSLDLFKITFNSLVTTAKVERATALATSLNEEVSDSDPFLRAAKQRADIVLRFEKRRCSTKLVLEKHPTHSEESLLIRQPTPRVLERFLEAT